MRRSSGFRRSLAGLAAVSILVVFAPLALANNYVVNSTLDEPDVDPSNGICSSTPSGVCTLRAAIMVTNFVSGPNVITLPAGTYKLIRPGYDDNALVGDLDIRHDLTIQGAGSGTTIVDGNGSSTHDRVFQVLSTVQDVTLSGMTIRNGESLTNPSPTPSPAPVLGGGGIYIEGAASVHLSDVILDSNTGQNGGGIYANFSSGGTLTLNNVIVRGNSAVEGGVGDGGGVYAHLPSVSSQFSVQDSQVYSNTADGTGGGFYVNGNIAAQWSVLRTQIYSNMAASGGGMGDFVPLSLADSSLHDNHASFDGGAIEAYKPYAILRTTVSANSAGRFGGGIFNLQLDSPHPSDPSDPHNDFALIVQSTFSGNFAHYGGGIYHDGFQTPASRLVLVNSTISGNSVALGNNSPAPSPSPSAAGGGIFIFGGRAELLNTTVAFNRVQLGIGIHQYVGQGGGLYIESTATPASVIARNSVIANNTDGNGFTLDTADDGYTRGSVSGELAYDLFTTTANFFITGPQGGNIVGQDPVLSPLQDNGGPTQTRTLLSGSPAIDAGAPGGCTDYSPSASPSPALMPLTSDQRGLSRPYPAPGPCDMGAVEVQPALSINDVSSAEGDSGTTSFVFTVTLSPASSQTVTVHFATAGGTAIAGNDYQAASNTLTFNPGDTSKTVTVLVNGDTTFEPNETFFVNLSSAVNAPIVKAQGKGTIVNDDAMPTPTPTATATPTATPKATATPTATAGASATPTATPKATATPTATPSPIPGLVANVSTRLPVGTDDNVLIEGFIVQGPSGSKKKIIVRAIGPSLLPFGITDALANPTLEIRDSNNALIASNNDWKSTQLGGIISSDQSAEITASGVAPSNDLESAVIANLAPGSYTAVVRGVNNSVGTGVVDAYDLSPGSAARLANIATRGLIQPGDKLMIAGFIIQSGPVRAVVRAIGPSLTAFGINNALSDTTLQLRDQNGALVVEDDDWKIRSNGSSQQAEVEATGLQPSDDREAAFVTMLQPGQYTAQVRGKPEGTGIGVVQVYFVQ